MAMNESDSGVEAEEASQRIFGCHVDGDIERLSESRPDERLDDGAIRILVAIDAHVEDR